MPAYFWLHKLYLKAREEADAFAGMVRSLLSRL
jgi:hypothetical protein